jgi:hypothetical protein
MKQHLIVTLVVTLFSCTTEEDKYDLFKTSLNDNIVEASKESKSLLSLKSSSIEVFLIEETNVKPKTPKESLSIELNSNQNNPTVSLDPLSENELPKTHSQYQEGISIVYLNPLSFSETPKAYSQYQEGVAMVFLDSITPLPPPPHPIDPEPIAEEIPEDETPLEEEPTEEISENEQPIESNLPEEETLEEEQLTEPDQPIEEPAPENPPVKPDSPIEEPPIEEPVSEEPPIKPQQTESEFIKLSENWAPGEPTGNQPYTFMVSDTGKWIDHHSTLNFDGYGLYQIKKSITLINQDLYPDFNDFFFLGELRGVTYFFSKNIMAADVYLNSRPLNGEATPVTLDSREKIEYIVSFYDQYSIRAFWIGLRKVGSEWEWIKD